MATKLRVVEDSEGADAEQFVSVLDAGERGSRIDELVQMRRILARVLDDPQTPAKELSALSRRYSEVSKEIAAIKREEQAETDYITAVDDEDFTATAI